MRRRCLTAVAALACGACTDRSDLDIGDGPPAFERLLSVAVSREVSGELRHQNQVTLAWTDTPRAGLSHDRYRLYRSADAGEHDFVVDCTTLCTAWVRTPPDCCTVRDPARTTFSFVGLDPNQTSHFVVRAGTASSAEVDTNEVEVTTGPHPSGMVLVDWVLTDRSRDEYRIYVDFTEAGCVAEDYDDGDCDLNLSTGRATGRMVDPPRPGYPPYTFVLAPEAEQICESVEIPGYGRKRLPTWKEHLVAASWAADPWDLDANAPFHDLERGTASATACNGDNHHGTGTDPVTGYGSFPTGSTGSVSTEDCVSYWGAQDIVGNLIETTLDRVECWGTGTRNGYCLGVANGVDDAILGWGYCDDDDGDTGGWACDYTAGLPRTVDGFEYTEANIQKLDGNHLDDNDISFITDFAFGLTPFEIFGITSVTDSGADPRYNGDYLWREYYNGNFRRRVLPDTHWNYGTGVGYPGRFTVNIDVSEEGVADEWIGFRCVLPVPID